MPAQAGIQYPPAVIIEYGIGYWIARIIKPVLGLAKPAPSAGQ
jgi:hypothetical protein